MHQQTVFQAPSGTTRKGSRHARPAIAALTAAALLASVSVAGLSRVRAESGVAVTDDTGTQVLITEAPQRVISLSPANTEIAFALGAGDRLVGGTDFDDFPAEAVELPDVATFEGVIMEQLVALEPDLVLASGMGLTPDADIVRMRELGIPVVVVYSTSVEDVLTDIKLVAEALGGDARAAAETLTTQMQADLVRIAELAASTGSRPRTFYETGDVPELYGVAPGSFAADMIERASGEAITTGDPSDWVMPLESLVEADPEVILLGDAAYGVCPDIVAAREGWGGITAVETGDIRPVDDIVVTRPGPRLAEGLASVARGIHPELAEQLADFPSEPSQCSAAPVGAP